MSRQGQDDLGTVLVTGATGQVGRILVAALLAEGCAVAVLTRSPKAARRLWPNGAVSVREADLTDPATLNASLAGIDTLFHLASYAPAPGEPDLYNAPRHWDVTVSGTANLLADPSAVCLKRLVYVSTVKAVGDAAGALGRPASENDAAQPDTLYGRAKLAAERHVMDVGRRQGIQTSVMRLPMVYGLDGAGNLARMIAAVAARRFPPWPQIDNHRSAIHVADAVRAAIGIARSGECAGQVYFVTDGRGYSTRWMYEQILIALGRPIPRWTVPAWLLHFGAWGGTLAEWMLRRRMPLTHAGLDKLIGDAWFSSDKLDRTLGFTPRHSLADEIPRLVRRVRA